MLVSRIGDDLAVRLSADDVERLGLKEGDEVEIRLADRPDSEDVAKLKAEAFDNLLKFHGMMPADFKFDRDEANER